LTSTSLSAIARDVLDQCVAGHAPDRIPAALVDEPGGRALFGILVEGLADRFEPALCDAYVRLFAGALAHTVPGTDAAALVARYQRIRRPHGVTHEPKRVWVLSRITLGADISVTSVVLAAAKQRFPDAEIVFVGPRKNYELFAGDPRIGHADLAYPRGSLADRLGVWEHLKDLLADGLVIDPDSRLTQLGLLPVCDEARYHFFESRAYAAETSSPLPELTAAWAKETFGVSGAKPYVALPAPAPEGRYIAVSLGVGGNPSKRLPDPFETELLKLLAGTGLPLRVDLGAGGEEAERVRRAVESSGAKAELWNGSFAGFAAIIAGSRLYVGYDSAGQHVAAAAGVPLISIFAGFPVPRMFDRWRPCSPNATVIRVDRPEPGPVLQQVKAAVGQVAGGRNGL
jgi:ADP-heptose:LPS heptosyltransferase